MPGFDQIAAAGAAFLAAFVECVEALTVILALGVSRGWRAPLAGAAASLAALGLAVAVFGPALRQIDVPIFRLVVGGLVLAFGLRWLRKAILRASGRLRLRDEDAAFTRTVARYQTGEASRPTRSMWDWTGFTGAFQVTLVEGVEVAFIVLALGSGRIGLAAPAAGALAATLAVVGLGIALHRPLSRIPENTGKLLASLMLVSFGTFWLGEGAGLTWPAGDFSLACLTLLWSAASFTLIRVLRSRGNTPLQGLTPRSTD